MTGVIEDWQLSASSVNPDDPSCQIKHGRLHRAGSEAWCAETGRGDTHHWLLVDLGVTTEVSGLLIQGRGDELEWTTLFTLAYSQDAFKWNFVHDVFGNKRVSLNSLLEKLNGVECHF